MAFYQISTNTIGLIDPMGGTGHRCKCEKNAMFILFIHGHQIHLCEQCLGELGKTIIDGLV